jgi:glucose/arabinose dehydrogenase
VFGLVTLALGAVALVLPSTATAVRLKRIARGFDAPVHVAFPRSGDRGGTYVVEQEGQIWRLRNGRRNLFLDIRDIVSCCGERGLLSVAFDEDYGANHLFYVNYTNNGGDTRVVRYRSNATFTRAVERSRRGLLGLDQPFPNHNGGLLVVRPNGRLYTGQGDGGGSCDPGDRAQRLSSLHGKLLSTDTDDLASGWRIDAYGLRNPWRYSFDRADGRLFLGDVGQNAWEEIDVQASSTLGGTPENYGWRVFEGFERGGCGDDTLGGPSGHRAPIAVYSHSLGCSITGGFVYRGSRLSSTRRGWYFFGDYCSGRIWRLLYRNGRLVEGRRLVLDTGLNVSSFGEGVLGELYVVHHGGAVYKLVRS